jgi:hypothetical protein
MEWWQLPLAILLVAPCAILFLYVAALWASRAYFQAKQEHNRVIDKYFSNHQKDDDDKRGQQS